MDFPADLQFEGSIPESKDDFRPDRTPGDKKCISRPKAEIHDREQGSRAPPKERACGKIVGNNDKDSWFSGPGYF